MNGTIPARAPNHRLVIAAVAVVIVAGAAIIGVHVHQASSASPLGATTNSSMVPSADGPITVERDGPLPDGVTVFDDGYVGISNLDPALLEAVREAATDAADDGIEFEVTSGWRSREYQDQLLREAVSEYGSVAEAARWVATADTSLHVSGDAIDIGPSDALSWLSEHGAAYGLCQVYRNEPWHYELRPEASDHGCPRAHADPTQDPRMPGNR